MSTSTVRILLHPHHRVDRWRVHLGEFICAEILHRADLAAFGDALARRSADVALIDLRAAGPDASDIVDLACSSGTLPVVVVADLDEHRRVELLSRGVTVVLDAEVSGEELAAQIRSVHDLVSDAPFTTVTFRPHSMEVVVDGRTVGVTDIEWKLLETLHAEPGRFFSAAELMARVWGHTVGPTSTVSVHIHRLRKKLETDPDHPAVLITHRGRGYALADRTNGIQRRTVARVEQP